MNNRQKPKVIFCLLLVLVFSPIFTLGYQPATPGAGITDAAPLGATAVLQRGCEEGAATDRCYTPRCTSSCGTYIHGLHAPLFPQDGQIGLLNLASGPWLETAPTLYYYILTSSIFHPPTITT